MLLAALLMWRSGARLAEATRQKREAAPNGEREAARHGLLEIRREIEQIQHEQRPESPEFLASQYEWEAAVSESTPPLSRESSDQQGEVRPSIPENIRAIIALEPSEREVAQRQEIAEYFRSHDAGEHEADVQIERLRQEEAALVKGLEQQRRDELRRDL